MKKHNELQNEPLGYTHLQEGRRTVQPTLRGSPSLRTRGKLIKELSMHGVIAT